MNKLIFLGTGAAASIERQLTSIVFSTPEKKFMFDCGDGMGTVRNLVRSGIPLDYVNDIFITHRHADHILGIAHLVFAKLIRDERAKIRIFAPPESIKVAKSIMYLTHDYLKMEHARIGFIPLKKNEEIVLAHDIKVKAIRVQGPSSFPLVSYGYIISIGAKRIVFTGDMMADDKFIKNVTEANILIHECFGLEEDKERVSDFGHSTARDAGVHAQSLKTKHLILTHYPDQIVIDPNKLVAEAKLYYSGKISLARDLMEVEI